MNVIRNGILTLASLIMVFVLAAPRPAHAQFVVSDPTQTALQGAKWGWEKGSEAVFNALLTAGKVALVNVAKSFFQQLAYDSAVYITSGGAGQKPQLFTENWDSYLLSAGEGAAGSFVEGLTSQFGQTICPPAQGPAFQKELTAGILSEFKPDSLSSLPTSALSQLSGGLNVPGGLEIPGLDVSNISFPSINESDVLPGGVPCLNNLVVNNLSDLEEQFKDDLGNFNQEGFLDSISSFLGPTGNDLAKSVDIYTSAIDEVSNKVRAEAEERFVNQGYKDTASKIAGYVQTPGSFIAEQAFDLTPKKLNATTEQEIAAMSASESLEFILANTAAVFLNTTAQSMIKKLTEEGFLALEQITGGGGSASGALASKTGSLFVGGKQQAELAYATLLTPRITAGGELDLMNEFAACPRGFRGQNNCVVDQQFVLAVNAAKQGQPLTIKQAIDRGLLHGDWKLYPPSHDLNSSLECYSGGYCYSNLVKLRRARIIPTGFEIAASLSPKQNPWQLKNVVDNFNVCDPQTGEWSDLYPFCHLIDPNWVLKAPPLRCNAQAFGPELTTAGVNTRQEVCVDLQDCPVTDDQGRCLGAWGYCVAEKNTWNFNADACPAQMAGCQLYTNRADETEGFLSTTVAHGVCEESNVGCKRYLNTKQINSETGEFEWIDVEVEFDEDGDVDIGTGLGLAAFSLFTDAPQLGELPSSNSYFKRAVTQCDPGDKGCTRVIREDGSELHMQIAPNYLHCYDYDIQEPGTQLPFTVEQAKEIAERKGCAEFAPVCAAEELGCQQYVPDAGGTTITGIAKNSDRCSSQCVGYNAFAQEATNFEQAVFPKFFIPATAQECSFDAIGCDEFTNLDAQAAGGEGREFYSFVRHCEKPGAVVPNFYTWEGSAQSGFQIQLHHLKADELGNPAYNTDDSDMLTKFAETCNGQTYGQNPDCREVYTEDGVVSYRLFSKTVTLSEDCSPLRRAGAIQSDCQATGGNWTNGTCLYNAIPSESISCAPQYAGCRAYQGNSAADQIQVINDTFESDLSDDFTGNTDNIEISSESLLVAGHSLRQAGGASWSRVFDVSEGAVYTVSFWAKGGGLLDVRFTRDDAEDIVFTDDQVSQTARTLTSVWRPYQFGPVQVPAGSQNVQLRVEGVNSDADIFIDNLVLTEGDVYALIKNSWRTPNACDSDQSDNLPGAALGCQTYSDTNENKNYLKSFTGLCREEAIGCENIIDTRNTEQEFAVQYNTRADDTLGTKNIDPNDNILIGADRVLRVVMKTEFLCAQAARGCTEYGFKHLEGEGENTKEVIDEVYLLNDPARYDQIVCQAEAVACEAYTSKSGTSYFKDPNILGKKCIYKQSDDPTDPIRGGWYKILTNADGSIDTSEPCAPGFLQSGKEYGIWKSSDPQYEEYAGTCEPQWDQCAEFVDRTDVDPKTGKPQAYYVIDNDKIDRASCQGRVSRQEGCVLFDDTRNPNRPYSANAAYETSEAQFGAFVTASNFPAQAQVKTDVIAEIPAGSLPCLPDIVKAVQDQNAEAICFALAFGTFGGFDASQICTSGGNLIPDGLSMLTGSEGYLAQCLTDVAPSNTILKVTRDRQCSAWLSPNSYTTVQNPQAGKQKQVTGLGLCQAVTTEKGGTAQCSDWISPTEHPFYGTVTTPFNYALRDTSFTAQDLSGLSAMNQFLPYHFQPVLLEDEEGNPSAQLLATISNDYNYFTGASENDLKIGRRSEFFGDGSQNDGGCVGKVDGSVCAPDNTGVCSGGICTFPINGTPVDHPLEQFGEQACRGFPEEDTPFDEKVVADWGGTVDPASLRDQRYASANVCQNGQNCSCAYQKVTYGNSTKKLYYEIGEDAAPGVCIGGFDKTGKSKNGKTCGLKKGSVFESCQDERETQFYDAEGNLQNADKPLRQDGLCQIRDTKVQNFLGWQGYCLEPDLRTPIQDADLQYACNSWYPIDAGVGLLDIDNQHEEAGYQAAEDGGRYWCAASTGTLSDTQNDHFDTFGGSGNNAFTYKEPAMPEFEVQLDNGAIDSQYLNSKSFGSIDDPDGPVYQNATLSNLDGIHVAITGAQYGDSANVPAAGSEYFVGNDDVVRCWPGGLFDFCKKMHAEIKKVNPNITKPPEVFEGPAENGAIGVVTFRQTHPNGDTDFVMLSINDVAFVNKFASIVGSSPNPWDIYGPDYGFLAAGEGSYHSLDEEDHGPSGCDDLGPDDGTDRLFSGAVVRFNSQGNPFVGIGAICHDMEESGHRPMQRWKISYIKNSQCTALYPAVDKVNGEEINYAFTQRLWNKQGDENYASKIFWDREKSSGNVGGFKLNVGAQGAIEYDRFRTPFGSMSIPKLGEQPTQADLVQYGKLFTFSQSIQNAELEHTTVPADQLVFNPEFGGNEIDGFPFSCPDGRCGDFQYNKVKNSVTSITQAFSTSLSKLFGAWFRKVQDNPGVTDSPGRTYQDVRFTQGRPPRIGALDLSTPLKGGAFPVTRLDAFNVNESDGRIYNAVGDDTGKKEFLFGIDNLSATIRFSSWADTDQMPLRSMSVDWGDSQISGGAKAKYKNRKPYCSTDGGLKPVSYCMDDVNVTCKSNDDCRKIFDDPNATCGSPRLVFGNDPDACDEGFYEFQHVYAFDDTCGSDTPNQVLSDKSPSAYPKRIAVTTQMLTNSNLGGYDYTLLRSLGVRAGDVLCIYKPKVQVKDNWGWCNGTCIDTGFGEGCMDGSANPLVEKDHCNLKDPDDKLKNGNFFDGEIIIVSDD